MTGTIRTFAIFGVVLTSAVCLSPREPAAASACPLNDTELAWREIQLRRKSIDGLQKAAADVERKAFEKLAKELQRKKFAASQADELLQLLKGLAPEGVLKEIVAAAAVSSADAAGCADLAKTVSKWRAATAKTLFAISKKAAKAGFNGSAYRYAERAVEFDGENKQARAALGQVKTKRGWLPEWRAKLEATGKVFDERAGWVAVSDLQKLQDGLLPLDGRWARAEEARAARSRWSSALSWPWGRWQIRSDLPIKTVVELSNILAETERALRIELGDRFQVALPVEVSVNAFRRRVDYEAHIDRVHQADTGLKSLPGFFAGSDISLNVLWQPDLPLGSRRLVLHEATHALFSETATPNKSAIAKGVGDALEEVPSMAVEALSALGAEWVSPQEPGIEGKAHRLAQQGRRMTLRAFIASDDNSEQFEDIFRLYDLAFALARFCGAKKGGPVVPWQIQEYLYYLRKNGPNPDLFAKIMGKPWPELEKDWSAFLDKLAAEGAATKKKQKQQ